MDKSQIDNMRMVTRYLSGHRADTAEILGSNPSISDKSLTICRPKDGEQIVTVGEVVVMQSDHVDHHFAMIKRILISTLGSHPAVYDISSSGKR